jgi:hypothetical protein
MKKFNKIIKVALLTTCLTSIAQVNTTVAAALDESLGNRARATLKNISQAVNTAVKRAEVLYENIGVNGIDPLAGTGLAANLLGTGTNPYLQTLNIANKGLLVQLQFVDSGMGKNTYNNTKEPIFEQLQGKKIILVPVFNYTSSTVRDGAITSWECATDADTSLSNFVNDNGLVEGRNSFISDYSDNKYLGNCQYISTTTLNAIWISA